MDSVRAPAGQPACMTEATLLTTARVRLTTGMCVGEIDGTNFFFVRSANGPRLVLTGTQLQLLRKSFAQSSTVPAALAELLSEQQGIRLREFYELVVRAAAAGLLVEKDAAVAAERPWSARLPVAIARPLGWVAVLAGLGAIPFGTVRPPEGAVEWVIGWVAGCLLLSAGGLLAGAVLSGAKLVVRERRWRWVSLTPHWGVDCWEAQMHGPNCQAAVALAWWAPLAVGAGAAAWLLPGIVFPLLLVLLLQLRPWGNAAGALWLHSRWAVPEPTLATAPMLKLATRDPWEDWQQRRERLESRWTVIQLGAAVLWGTAWLVLLMTALPGPTASLLAALPAGSMSVAARGVAVAVLATALVVGVLLVLARVRSWLQRRRALQPSAPGDSFLARPREITSTAPQDLRQFELLRTLPEEDLRGLAEKLERIEVPARKFVIREDEPGDAFYLVGAGRLEVTKNVPRAGLRPAMRVIGRLGPGDCFGEIALLDATPRTASVRAAQDSQLWRLTRTDFDELLVRRVGLQRISELLQNTVFLGRLVQFSDWSLSELAAFAQRCSRMVCPPGRVHLQRGQPNSFFYLIYDGAFEVKEEGRVIRRLGPGDYFGEISLLDGTRATADVVAVEESRCLALSWHEFFDFFSRDFRLALRIDTRAESLRSRRNGNSRH